MTNKNKAIYIRGLRQVDHTVFCVTKGQKTYKDPVFGKNLPYSSGQQVKHSILNLLSDQLTQPRAKVVFNWQLSKKAGSQKLEEGEAWSTCDPSYPDQLIGGWMKASKDAAQGVTVKRRSPLSISALRPLHPTLAAVSAEQGTFDRSDHPEQHVIRVTDDNGKEVPADEFLEFLKSANRSVPLRKFLPEDQLGPRASGLFIYDVAVDLATLFSVSTSQYDPELSEDTSAKLLREGWKPNKSNTRLVCPETSRKKLIPALAHSLVHWRVTSNQSRTFSLQNTLALAISDNANQIGTAIRADLSEEQDWRAEPVVDRSAGAEIFVAPTAKGSIRGVDAKNDALEQAEKHLVSLLLDHGYDD